MWSDRGTEPGIIECFVIMEGVFLTFLARLNSFFAGLLICILPASLPGRAQEGGAPNATEYLYDALQASRLAQWDDALELANKAIALDPRSPNAYYVRGQAYDFKREFDKALKDYNLVLAMEPGRPDVLNVRGALQFRRGNIEASIEDFSLAIQLKPDDEPHHWQRGISYYYAGRYEEGKRQFELHQTVNANDVENAVWHVLCNAGLVGAHKAREAILPVGQDGRVPMQEVYRLFRGDGSIDEVFEAVHVGDPSEAELTQRLFFAHLYSGLYHELIDSPKWAQEHLTKASEDYRGEHYMWEVARIHAERYRQGEQ